VFHRPAFRLRGAGAALDRVVVVADSAAIGFSFALSLIHADPRSRGEGWQNTT
jgi:hypothetical protein